MAGNRKPRTGLEWLLDKEPPKKAEENDSAGAAAPAVPDAAAASDVDALLALLDLPPGAPAASVLSAAPAESSLALDADRGAEPPSDAHHKRTLDAVANALAISEPEPKPPEEESPGEGTESLADAKTAKTPAARRPEDADGVSAKGATVLQDEKAALVPEEEIEEDAAGDEQSQPPVEREIAEGLAAHRKAVSSGRSTRASPRANVPFEARFKKGSDAITATGRNVSIGGFFMETNKLLPDGEVFQAQLFFPKKERKMSVIAEVMWASAGDPEDLARFPPGMGCKFLDVDERNAPFIQGVIDAALAAGAATP